MSTPKKYIRSSSTMTISQIYEYYQLKKFNFNPVYQRDDNIWKTSDKEYLIDTIFKNFPMPPVFFEQKIKNGKTSYDVIDGKQRLTTIVSFIENEIHLPETFDSDVYGYTKLNGKYLEDITEMATKDEIVKEYVDIFWGYKIGIELIENPDKNIVKGIFDRLNRNGVRLNPAELRKAKYGDTELYKIINEIVATQLFKTIRVSKNDHRQRNINFCTEILLLVAYRKILSGSAKTVEANLNKLLQLEHVEVENLKITLLSVLGFYDRLNINTEKYDLQRETHLYTLIYLAFYAQNKNICPEELGKSVNEFYEKLRSHDKEMWNTNLQEYYDATQSGSKSTRSREKRIVALFNEIGLPDILLKE